MLNTCIQLLGPLSSIQLTGFAAAFVQWDISIHFFCNMAACCSFSSSSSFRIGRILLRSDSSPSFLDRQKPLQDIDGMAEFFVDLVSSLFPWLLFPWFLKYSQ